MLTAIGLVLVFACLAAAIAAAARVPSLVHGTRIILAPVGHGLRGSARVAAAAADLLLAGRSDKVVAWRVALFAAVGALPLVMALGVPVFPPVAAVVDPGGLLTVGSLAMLLVLLAAAFIVREDQDVMDGIVAEDRRQFRGAHAAARPAAVLVATVLVVAYIAAGAWWLTATHNVPLVAREPAVGGPLVYLLIALRALPTDPLLSLLDRATGDDTHVVFGSGLAAAAYFFLVRILGIGIAMTLIVVAVERTRQVRRFLAELEASDAYRPELIARGRRAPRSIVRGILDAATARGGGPRQERVIAAAVEMGLRDFPVRLCARLSHMKPDQQSYGLDRAVEMFRYRTREYDAAEALALVRTAAGVFAAGKLDLEPTKKLTRLMISVVIFKKDSLQIPESLRTVMMDALKVELAKPRARDDAALRGILRDLQSALGGEPIVVKPITLAGHNPDDWLRQLNLPQVDRAAQPETPSTTVH